MILRIFLIMAFLSPAVNGWANEVPKAEAAAPVVSTREYVHSWTKFPALTLKDLESGEAVSRETQAGRVLIVAFLASWCVPCQQIVDDIQDLQKKYQDRYTDIVYVFAHDTDPDAKGFINFHKLGGAAYLGTAKTLEAFHQPELPSVYVSDRYGWLLYRKLNMKEPDLAELDRLLKAHTAF